MDGLNFTQASAIMNAVFKQATGKESIASIDTKDFVSQATTVLSTGYNNTISALSIVLSRTIFSVRPYSRKLNGIKKDSNRWGNHVRKVTILDKPVIDNSEYSLSDGDYSNPWLVRKPEVLQTNFYSADTWSDCVTRFINQLDTAFRDPQEFGSFVGAVMQEMSDKWEKYYEENDRMLIANGICAKKAMNNGIINLLSEYYKETGTYLVTDKNDSRFYRNKANINDFSKWVSGFIKTISKRLTERSLLYHVNFTGKDIPRHTPREKQHLYLYSPEVNGVRTRVLSDVFNPEMLGIGDFEEVSYWQSITPGEESIVKCKPNYVNATGEIVNGSNTITVENVFGILFDDDFMGSSIKNVDVIPTGVNAKDKFWSIWYHVTRQYWQDLTENCIVFILAQTEIDPDVMSITPSTLSIAKNASKTVTVNYPQGAVTATVTQTGTGITATYSAETGKVTVAVASDATSTGGTVEITDGTTTETVTVTVTGS